MEVFYMKKMIEKSRRSGFTLVELLIVIMIIAILAGMMMLATGSATDTANATRIINDLRTVKTAVTIILAEYGATADDVEKGEIKLNAQDAAGAGYAQGDAGAVLDWFFIMSNKLPSAMDVPLWSGAGQGYSFMHKKASIDFGGTKVDRWLSGFTLNNAYDFDYIKDPRVQKKLEDQAEAVGLYNGNGEFFKVGDDYIGLILQ